VVVRLKVSVREPSGGKEFESEEPEVSLPMSLAEKLSLKAQDARAEDFVTVAGPVTLRFLAQAVEVSLKVGESARGPVTSGVVLSPSRGEVLLSDKLISALGIELLDPGRGIWRLNGEETKRKSVEREIW
jgi:hypothetical protein